jgi:hypothetical protein
MLKPREQPRISPPESSRSNSASHYLTDSRVHIDLSPFLMPRFLVVRGESPVSESLSAGVAFCDTFFMAYNHEHRHSGIGMHTPASVHFGTAEQIRAQRQITLNHAYAKHPERFARRPRPPQLPKVAWINQPTDQPQPTS